jgi:DNA-binding response OmpR family regulator
MNHPDPDPPDPSNRPRVLLVEDNDAARRSLTRLLQNQRFAVTSAPDGLSGVRLLQTEPRFDVLLTDLRLPDLDGREVARVAHELPDPPRIALITGWDLDPEPGSYASWGIEWVFTKPLDFDRMVATFREALASRRRAEPPADPRRDGSDSAPGTA